MTTGASGDDSYIAWDGGRYPGRPPDGWYLAADNRWWPSPDTIARQRTGPGAPAPGAPAPDRSALDRPGPGRADPGALVDRTGSGEPGAPEAWAPTPADRHERGNGGEATARIGPMTTGLGAGSGSVVTWLWSRRRSKPLRIGVAVLLYLILRTGWSAGGDTGPSAPVTAAPEVGVPALDVTSEVISCGPEMAFGLVQNQTDAPHDYLVEIEIDRGDGDTDVVEREVTTEPRGGALWTVLFDESLPNATCTVSAIHLDG